MPRPCLSSHLVPLDDRSVCMPCWFYRRIHEYRKRYGAEPGFPLDDPALIPWSAYKPPEGLMTDPVAAFRKKLDSGTLFCGGASGTYWLLPAPLPGEDQAQSILIKFLRDKMGLHDCADAGELRRRLLNAPADEKAGGRRG